MKHIKLYEGFSEPVKKGMTIKGGMGLSFEEGTLADVNQTSSNMIDNDKKKLYVFKYTVKVTKNHPFSKKKIDATVIEILAKDRKDADQKFLERLK